MKILKLTAYTLAPVEPVVYRTKNNVSYYNIVVGTRDINHKRYIIKLNKHYFDPDTIENLTLNKDNYVLIPFLINGKIADGNELHKDSNGNPMYILSKDNETIHKKDILVFWEIPNIMYTDVKFNTSGYVEVIARASSGKTRQGKIYTSPYPVLEVFGDCRLSWSARDKNGCICRQDITYNQRDDKWDIGVITTEEAQDGTTSTSV